MGKTKKKAAPKVPTFRKWLDDNKFTLDTFVAASARKGHVVRFSTVAKWAAGVHAPYPATQENMKAAFPSIRW